MSSGLGGAVLGLMPVPRGRGWGGGGGGGGGMGGVFGGGDDQYNF